MLNYLYLQHKWCPVLAARISPLALWLQMKTTYNLPNTLEITRLDCFVFFNKEIPLVQRGAHMHHDKACKCYKLISNQISGPPVWAVSWKGRACANSMMQTLNPWSLACFWSISDGNLYENTVKSLHCKKHRKYTFHFLTVYYLLFFFNGNLCKWKIVKFKLWLKIQKKTCGTCVLLQMFLLCTL